MWVVDLPRSRIQTSGCHQVRARRLHSTVRSRPSIDSNARNNESFKTYWNSAPLYIVVEHGLGIRGNNASVPIGVATPRVARIP
jgi:hypothetical protein